MKLSYSLPAISFLGDLRLDQRFIKLLNGLSQDIEQSIAKCLVKSSQVKAVYRFFSNLKVTHTRLMSIEEDQLIKTLIQKDVPLLNGSARVILHFQDTTTFNLSGQKGARQLPCLNSIHQRGYFGHSGVVSDDTGCIEGMSGQDVWGRSEEELGTNKHFKSVQNGVPIECKESSRWVHHFEHFQSLVSTLRHTHGISISDAESDIYELFIAKKSENVDLIVRSQHNRDLVSAHGTPDNLDAYLATLPIDNYAWIEVLNDDKHTYRSVKLAVRFGKVALQLPENLKWSSVIPRAARRLKEKMAAKNGLSLHVIEVTEIDAPQGVKPIHWTLLTTLPINDYWDALRAIRYYALRWRIEIFHLVLKEGCVIEETQLEKPQRIQNAIAVYSIIAAKVTNLRYLAQTQGEMPMTVTGYTPRHFTYLNQYLISRYNLRLPQPKDPKEIPTVAQFVHLVVCLAGGHKGNKNKQIGIRVLWQGLSVAQTVIQAFEACLDLPPS